MRAEPGVCKAHDRDGKAQFARRDAFPPEESVKHLLAVAERLPIERVQVPPVRRHRRGRHMVRADTPRFRRRARHRPHDVRLSQRHARHHRDDDHQARERATRNPTSPTSSERPVDAVTRAILRRSSPIRDRDATNVKTASRLRSAGATSWSRLGVVLLLDDTGTLRRLVWPVPRPTGPVRRLPAVGFVPVRRPGAAWRGGSSERDSRAAAPGPSPPAG